MIPTADQVAHAIVAASRHYGVDPIEVAKRVQRRGDRGYMERSRALIYAGLAISDLIGNDERASRIVGMTESRLGNTRWQIRNNALKWFDPATLELVKAAIPGWQASPPVRQPAAEATEQPPRAETAQDRPAAPPSSPPMDFVRVGAKRRLEDELRAAILNTGGKLA